MARAELVGTAEIAQRLGLKHRQRLHDWRQRYPDFPEPVEMPGLRRTLVWRWVDIERWARKHGRLPT